MPVGAPRSKKFLIGTAELRVGQMSSALKLLQTHSVGLVDNVNVTVSQESVDLEGGFPKQLIDSAIVRQTSEISATLREYSRRNLRMMLGEGVSGTTVTDISSTVNTTAAAAATSVTLATGGATGMVAGDLLVSYKLGAPENVQIVRILSIAVDVLTLDADTPLLFEVVSGDPVFLARPVAIGAVSQTNYMAVSVLQKENSTGRPIVWNFWKASISGNLDYASNAEDFASSTVTLKALQPAAEEYGVGGALAHLADIIPTHPTGMLATGGGS